MSWKFQPLRFGENSHSLASIKLKGYFKGIFKICSTIQYCFIYCPSDSTVSEDAGIKLRWKGVKWQLSRIYIEIYCTCPICCKFYCAWAVVYKSPFLAIVQEQCWRKTTFQSPFRQNSRIRRNTFSPQTIT